MNTQRLFVALPLPEPVRNVVAELMRDAGEARWMPLEQLHITLRFLGDVAEDKMELLTAKLREVRVEPFVLGVEGVGIFPPQGAPRVLWVGLGSGHPRLHQLRQKIDGAALSAGVDFDVRTFHPHVTVARVGETEPKPIHAWVKRHGAFAGPCFRVDAFDLMASELHPRGATHRLVERVLLDAKPAAARVSS